MSDRTLYRLATDDELKGGHWGRGWLVPSRPMVPVKLSVETILEWATEYYDAGNHGDGFERIDEDGARFLLSKLGILRGGGRFQGEYVRKQDVCICMLGEGFEPEPSDLHNSWCSYEPEAR